MNNNTANDLGWFAYFSGLLTGFIEWFTYDHVNGIITLTLGFGGIIFIFWNIRFKRAQTKLAEQELENKENEK